MRQPHSPFSPSRWISLLGLLCAGGAFLHWNLTTQYSLPGRLAALVSVLLFVTVCLRFVPRWMAFWQIEGSFREPAVSTEDPPLIGPMIFAGFLLFDLMILFLTDRINQFTGMEGSFAQRLQFWTCTDSQHYLDIARDWYLSVGPMDRLVQLVFLPGYPLAIRLMERLIPDPLTAAMTLSGCCFAAAGWLLYRLLRLDLSHRDALFGTCVLCLLPGAFFFAAPMSESLFLLLCVGCMYLTRREHWFLGCLLGGYAAFTRSPGILLAVPLCMEWVARTRAVGCTPGQRRKVPCLLLIPAGFAAYCFVNYKVSGNPFQFMIYQSAHWHQGLGWFWNTAAYQTEHALSCILESPERLWGLWLPNLIWSFGSLCLMIPACKRLRPSETAWFIAYFAVTIGATWLLSAPRYLVSFYPISKALAVTVRSGKGRFFTVLLCLILSGLYLCAFVLRWQVW